MEKKKIKKRKLKGKRKNETGRRKQKGQHFFLK